MTLMESLYHGLPVITSNTPGASSIVQHQRQGLVLATCEVSDWADGIEALWMEPLNRNRMRECVSKDRASRVGCVGRSLRPFLFLSLARPGKVSDTRTGTAR